MPQNALSKSETARHRGDVLRDVVVFQLKMALGGARDFALIPVSLAAALFDLLQKRAEHGYYFYKVLRWARHTEEIISLYTPVDNEPAMVELNPNYTIDAVVARIEEVVVREYQQGATAAAMKESIEKVVGQLRAKSAAPKNSRN